MMRSPAVEMTLKTSNMPINIKTSLFSCFSTFVRLMGVAVAFRISLVSWPVKTTTP